VKGGVDTWVALPEFPFDAPNPISIGYYVDRAMEDLVKHGFTGDNVLLAGHSLGGVFAQHYANTHTDKIKGLILMGSVLERKNHKINEEG